MSQWLAKYFNRSSADDVAMAQDQEQQQAHAAGQDQHAESGDSMQMLVIRLLLAASQTSEPVASELKDIAMTLSCATMATRGDTSYVSVKDEPSSNRGSAVPSLGMLTDGTSAPRDARDGSNVDHPTSTALVLRDQAPTASPQGTPPPTHSQHRSFEPPHITHLNPGHPSHQPGLQLDSGQRNFPSAGAKRSYPFEHTNVSEGKRQQHGFFTGPPGRRPVCRECIGAGLGGSCDHTARCNNCKARGGVNCVYVACMQGMRCTAPQCHLMHPNQWRKTDRPVWQLKTSHLPPPPGAPAPEPRPPPLPKQWRKNSGPPNQTPWAAPRQKWSFGGVTVTSDQPFTFTSNRSSQPASTGPMTPMAAQADFASLPNAFATAANSTRDALTKFENGPSNATGGSASVAPSETEFPRGLLKYENDE